MLVPMSGAGTCNWRGMGNLELPVRLGIPPKDDTASTNHGNFISRPPRMKDVNGFGPCDRVHACAGAGLVLVTHNH